MDEFVQVITGSLTFTSDKGEVHEFGPDDRLDQAIKSTERPSRLNADCADGLRMIASL